MTATGPDVEALGVAERAACAVNDTLTLTTRELLLWIRVPAHIMFTVVQPVMFVLMFRCVFGGAIPVNVHGGCVSFLTPGIIGQTAAFASFATAIALARQSRLGVIDRFRAMPMVRGAVLGGRLCADAGRPVRARRLPWGESAGCLRTSTEPPCGFQTTLPALPSSNMSASCTSHSSQLLV